VISDTVVYDFIRAWKRSVFSYHQGWPSESILAKIVEYLTRLDASPIQAPEMTDGEVLADIVREMSNEDLEVYLCFIAYHLAVINGERKPKMRYVDRACALGVTRDQFNYRNKQGFLYCRKRLDEYLQ